MLWRILLRALLPSWNFFSEVDEGEELQHRVKRVGDETWSAWQDTLGPAPRRGSLALFVNAEGNLRLAWRALLPEAASSEEARETIEALVRERVGGAPAERFEYRVLSGAEPLYVSPPLQVRA